MYGGYIWGNGMLLGFEVVEKKDWLGEQLVYRVQSTL